MLDDEAAQRLLQAIGRYDAGTGLAYDEVFLEVHQRIAVNGDAGKLDIATITFWKRSAQGAWIKDLLAVPEIEVRATTRRAFAATDDASALAPVLQ